ncbi:uncharacterized protein LOC131629832 [Vicia villosa]|uniref:uncharacterized protein LOC131629832 n=1 Tax=Vicia villosa TaxID=3911 RepID=UPI00273B47AC|nr:uncharacterized protein LOC131629832 [Vicia villosa]
MANWRKNQTISSREVGHRRSSSYYGKPPLNNRFSTVLPLWDKRYMESHAKVMKWEDYAVKQAFYDAKFRYCAAINGYRWDIPLPDPDMYIDDVDWGASVDPELYLDLDREDEARRNMIAKSEEESVILGIEGIEPTGWGDDDEEVTKPREPSYGADENNEINSWEENDSQRWTPKEHYVADFPNMYQARNDGYDRRKNNMSWSKNHGNSDYQIQMNQGRRNGRGGRRKRGNYSYAAKVAATPSS